MSHLNGTINDSIQYVGLVDISYKIGDKVYNAKFKNNGTTELFRIICKALSGSHLNKKELPSLLNMSIGELGQQGSTQVVATVGTSGGQYHKKGDDWYVVYTATFSRSQIIYPVTSIEPETVIRANILNDNPNGSQVLAYINLWDETQQEPNIGKQILETVNAHFGVQAIIEWSMKVVNYPEENNE